MDVNSLKEYIYENDKIEFVLEKIGCHHIQYHLTKDYYSCSNYNGDNRTAVNIKNNKYLNVKNWTREREFENADLITLVEYNKHYSFIEAIKYLHKILGLDFSLKTKYKPEVKKENPVDFFTKHITSNKVDVSDLQTINSDILNDYTPLLYIGWFKEGIMPWTAKKFGLAYSYRRNRVIIPMRYWMDGSLLGINSRTTVDNYEEFGIKKFYITPSYPKNINLFGLWENYNSIQKAGYVVVYEAEKSVMKRDSLNDSTGVALSGHTISEEQVRILKGLNVEIIIALDNDIHIDEIRFLCEKFCQDRRVSYIKDRWDLLGKKDSPADAKQKVFQFLFKNRIVYGIDEHKKYLNSLKRK